MATKEQLAKIISERAMKLCSPEGDRIISSRSRQDNIRQIDEDTSVKYHDVPKPDYNYDVDYELNSHAGMGQARDIQYGSNTTSKIPDAIKQSMLENRIDVYGSGTENQDFLDEIAKKRQTKIIQEQKQIMQQPQTVIDYSLIKSIVKECLQEANKGMLAENNLKQIRLTGGKIKLIDNSGNVYSASLQKVGNVNDNK